jgi:hypothetical protein
MRPTARAQQIERARLAATTLHNPTAHARPPYSMQRKHALLQRLLKHWSRRSVTISEQPPAAPTASPLDRLEIQTAIIEHLEWCAQFNERLGLEHSHSRPAPALPAAHESGLGRWLGRVRGGATGQHPLFDVVEREHLRLHALAAKALALSDAGQMHLASTLLNTHFERSRTRLLELLRALHGG